MPTWMIEVTLDMNPVPFQLCRCLSPESAGEIVRALCACPETRPITVRRVESADTGPVAGIGQVVVAADDLARLVREWDQCVPRPGLTLDDAVPAIERLRAALPPF